MTFVNHSNTLCSVTLHFPPSTPPPSSGASPSSTSSNSWTQKITKKIEELKKQKKLLEERKNAQSGYLPEQDSKSLDSLPTQLTSLETMQKLAEFAEQLDPAKNASNNILNNLCSGLQTFLGFDSQTKGYDGTGIVYSDLDRLCDGVMAFLSGVLSNIQSHLGQHKTQINDAINILNKNKHAGKNGFNVAIVKVVEGVRGYNGKVRESNERIKKPMNELIEHMEQLHESIVTLKNHNHVDVVNLKTQECLRQVQVYGRDMDSVEKDIGDIQEQLKNRIKNANKSIKYQRERLDEIYNSQKKDMTELTQLVDNTLNTARDTVKSTIALRIQNFVTELNRRFADMKQEIEIADGDLQTIIHDLGAWIDKAHKAVEKALEQLDKMLDEVDDTISKHENRKRMKEAVNDLERKGLDLYHAYTQVNTTLPKLIENVTKVVAGLDETIKNDLSNLTSTAEEAIKKYVTDATHYFKIIKEHVLGENGKGDQSGIMKNWDELQTDISEIAGEIYTEGREKCGNLGEMVEGVMDYAMSLSKETFEGDILKGWIKKCMNTDIIKLYIEWYLDKYKNEFEDSQFKKQDAKSTYPKLIPFIIDKVADELAKRVQNAKPRISTDGSYAKNLDYIQRFFNDIADKADYAKAEGIVSAIEGKLKVQRSVTSGDDYDRYKAYLTTAIQYTFIALASTAKQPAEIKNLIERCKLKNVGEAIRKIAEIRSCITSNHGNNITKALEAVQKNIGELDAALRTNLKTQLISKFQKAHSQTDSVKQLMVTYAKHVGTKQSKAGEDSIYGKIYEIKENALKPFKDLESKIDKTKLSGDATDFYTHFSALCDSILSAGKNAEDSATNILNNLKQWIGKHTNGELKNLRTKLGTLRRFTLHPLIDHSQGIIQHASERGQMLIRDLEHHINTTLDMGRDSITQDIKTKYVCFIKAQVSAFAETIVAELQDFPHAITKDSNKSAKGFMGVLHGVILSSELQRTLSKGSTVFDLSFPVNNFFNDLFDILKSDRDIMPEYKISSFRTTCHDLFTGLSKYDAQFADNLAALNKLLTEIQPTLYNGQQHVLLNILKDSFHRLHRELDKAYVNKYSGAPTHFSWTEVLTTGVTEYGLQCAKVFVTLLSTLKTSLQDVKRNCKSLPKQQLNTSADLGKHFAGLGFEVSSDGDQNGELQDASGMTGAHILGRMIGPNKKVYTSHDDAKDEGPLYMLCYYMEAYYQASHLAHIPGANAPCNIYQMLCWFSGLQYNPVYSALLVDGISDPFIDPNKPSADIEGTPVLDLQSSYIDAYPHKITYKNTAKVLGHLCSKSYEILVTVVGTGNAYTTYGCDMSNNSMKFHYPTSGEECLQTILDIVHRLVPPLKYLFYRCSISAEHNGWRNCEYGRDASTSKSQCKQHSTCKPNCKTKCEPNCQANCQPTSPLMSYLGDCLPGHLPHHLSDIGCKAKCSTCPTSKRGMPCLTPLGFRAFSGSTKTGYDLCEILRQFFGGSLLSSLLCLAPKPPSTLPEHLSFVTQLFRNWQKIYSGNKHVVQYAFEDSIKKMSIKLVKDTAELCDTFRNIYGHKHNDADNDLSHAGTQHADVISVCLPKNTNLCSGQQCAPYLQSLCHDSYLYLAPKHADVYVSWAVYLPWSLYQMLQSLLDAFTRIICQDWGCKKCMNGAKCRQGQHGTVDKTCKCLSVVSCNGVWPTLYQHGFTFGDAAKLNAEHRQKMCFNFYTQLKSVLESEYFETLFKQCDKFLFTIRLPFFWLTVALWSLSLLYLICVMVGRLDVLHIRSHLRIPSSHKITAQSLLAAAQVGRLAKISYLQP